MAIDQARYAQFSDDLDALIERLPARQLARSVRAKLLDYIRRAAPLTDADLDGLEQLLSQLLGDSFDGYANAIRRTYDDIVEVVNEHYADLTIDITRDFDRIRAIESVASSDLGDYEASTVQRIARQLREGVTIGEDVDALVERMRGVGGKAGRRGLVVGRTLLKDYGRALKWEKALIAEIEFFEYVGPRLVSNRPFCAERIGNTYSITAIDAMRNLNRDPVFLHCGGWNCRHDWEPDPFATAETPR